MSQQTEYCIDINDELVPELGTEGSAAMPAITAMEFMKEAVDKYNTRPCLHYKEDGVWKKYTWNEYYDYVLRVGNAMVKLGVNERAGVAILGFNRPEWYICNMGSIFANLITTGLYLTNGDIVTAYMINKANCEVAFVDEVKYADKLLKLKSQCPKLKHIIMWNKEGRPEGVIAFDEFLKDVGSAITPELQARMDKQRPGHCCEIVFTSGTTGQPKGVMLSHDNLRWAATASIAESLGKPTPCITADDTNVSFLPLCHVAAQVSEMWGQMCCGYQICFAQPDALKGSLVQTLKEIRPTIMLAVPRVYEKMMESIKQIGAKNSGVKKMLVDTAKDIGLRGNRAREQGQSVPFGWSLSNWIVWSKVKEAMGMDKVKYFFSGAAPLRTEVAEFFMALNIYICQIFGMSECAGPAALSLPQRPGCFLAESIGMPLDGSIMKTDVDGELMIYARNVFMGYLGDEESSKQSLEKRWIRTGDLARIDEKGRVFITGRKKELIKTAGGEYVAPMLIETYFQEQLQFVSQAICVGEGRKFVSILLTVKCKVDEKDEPTDELSPAAILALANKDITDITTVSAMITDPRIAKLTEEVIENFNKTKAVSRAASVRKYVYVDKDLSIANGCLTPTMKILKKKVFQQYSEAIDKLYRDDIPEAV